MPEHLNTIEAIEKLLDVDCILPEGTPRVALLGKKNPDVLVNLRPYTTLNAVHYLLLQRIAALTSNGFNVTLLFYDQTVLQGADYPDVKSQKDANAAMDWLARVFRSYDGVRAERLEFLSESLLWQMQGLRASMPGPLHALVSHASRVIPLNSADLASKTLEYYYDTLMGLLYEHVLNPDYVFFAGVEAKYWRDVKSRVRLSNALGQDRCPTAILRLSDIPKYGGKDPLQTNDRKDPFCTDLRDSECEQLLTEASEEYANYIVRANILNRQVDGGIEAIVRNFHRKYHGFV